MVSEADDVVEIDRVNFADDFKGFPIQVRDVHNLH